MPGTYDPINTTRQGNPFYTPMPTPSPIAPGAGAPASSAPPPAAGTASWYAKLIGKSKGVALPYLYNDVQDAISGPDLYSSNDIRNSGLAIQSSAGQGWRDFLQGANQQAAMTGMQDSGFYSDYLARKGAAQNAALTGAITANANSMAQANQTYRQTKLQDSMSLLSMFLTNQRRDRLSAMQLANAFGIAGA